MAVKVLSSPIGIEAQRSLGCQPGTSPSFGSGTQQSRINDALQSTSYRFSPVLPGGDWEITGSIEDSAKWGPSLRGAGGLGRDFGDAEYPSGTGSTQVSRIIWDGADEGTMYVCKAGSPVIESLWFQGCRVSGTGSEPIGGTYPNRAKIGLRIATSTGGAVTGGCNGWINHLGFHQVHTGILVGDNLDDVGAVDYTGDDSAHADEINFGGIHGYWPFSGIHSGAGTLLHIRNAQSMAHNIQLLSCHGNLEQVLYIERGGKVNVGTITHNGFTGYALRIGSLDINAGGVTVGNISMDAGGIGSRLLKGDVHTNMFASQTVEINRASIPPGLTTVPQVDVGPGMYTLRNVNYLQAESIKMTGLDPGLTNWQLSWVHLDRCCLLACTPTELLDPASSGPYLLTWSNCSNYHDGGSPILKWGMPFTDSTSANWIDNPSYTITPLAIS